MTKEGNLARVQPDEAVNLNADPSHLLGELTVTEIPGHG
jgi:hypothetical protein